MKRTVISLICPIIIGLFFTSCLPEAEETERTSTVAMLSFSINDLKTRHTITLENGKDSTYTTIMKTSLIPFTIDHNLGQEQGYVYNTDSIVYGTDVSKVLASISADGYVFYYKEGEKTGYNKEDTIDFTHPVKFTVVSNDENYSRDYLVSVNVHKVDSRKTEWKKLDGANFPAGLFAKQKAIARDRQVYVFGCDADGNCYTTSTDMNDGTVWSDPMPWTGIEGEADCASVMLFDDKFYMLVDSAAFRSDDGIAWEAVATNGATCLLAVTAEQEPVMWGVRDNAFVYSQDMLTWNTNGQSMRKAIDKCVGYYSEPLKTNANICRTIAVGQSITSTDTCAMVWSKLSTEEQWTEVVPVGNNVYGCPNLKNLAVISYRDRLYAFGGESIGQRRAPLKAFGACYESRDNGITWREYDDAFKLAKDFVGRDEDFTTVVDSQNRVWMIWAQSGEVWRGLWTPNK